MSKKKSGVKTHNKVPPGTEVIPQDELVPAIPPVDYEGSQADWMIALVTRGLWDDSDGSWHGDVMISQSVWWEILEECEGEGE